MSSVYHTHRLPELYHDPLRFLPARWQGAALDAYSYCPFGAGPRMCLGASFALLEIKILLAIVLQKYRFELVPDTRVDRVVSITMSPKYGLPMRVHKLGESYAKSARRVRGNVHEMVHLEMD